MGKKILITIAAVIGILICHGVLAEDLPSGVVIPKLEKTANDPRLSNGKIYPFWGPVCQRYTYSVVYSDQEGRAPEYVQIYFNGEMLDMDKADTSDNDYKKGVQYIYKNVPNKFGSNFYYFEASNGLGKTRDSIIDSPDNGPVLFDSDFLDNEIVLIDPATGQEVWRYQTGEEWVGGVVLSDDGEYVAAQTSNHIYLFATSTNEPLWEYESPVKAYIGGDVKGGVAISADGNTIFAALNGKALMFNQSSAEPIWTYNLEANGGGAYGVDISQDGQHMAVAMAGMESEENSNVLLLFDAEGNKLWQYHSPGNWHEVNFSSDGSYLSGATGCPDRRGYLFSVNSDEPIIKSEPLSLESPIDEASISSDGNLVAYGVESGYGAIVLMDRQTKQIVWKYETPQGRSVRALAMTPDAEYIGAGTFGGDILIFTKDSNEPIEKLKINTTIGAFDMADDGSFFATGSADKKVRIFTRGDGQVKTEIVLNEYVGELDISADSRYAVAGTSGSVYFFETLIDLNNTGVFTCNEVIEPPEEDTTLFGGQNGGDILGNNQKASESPKSSLQLAIIFVSLGGLLLIIFTTYFIICRRKNNLAGKKMIFIAAAILIIVCWGVVFYFWQAEDQEDAKGTVDTEISGNNNNEAEGNITNEDVSTNESLQENSNAQDGLQNVIETEGNSSNVNEIVNTTEGNVSGSSVCGNGMCEPSLGETKQDCPQDCQL
ncbi:MAG: WD40 repeat domain-containing protein [bacterium]|nr:WD40 repeat domain-containing protein [bacterium]